MSSWRKDFTSMGQRMKAILDNQIPDIPHDVIFTVGEEKTKISCHKLILMAASPVFEAMFSKRFRCQKVSQSVDSDRECFERKKTSEEVDEASEKVDETSEKVDEVSEKVDEASEKVDEASEESDEDETSEDVDELDEVCIPDVMPVGLYNLIKYAYNHMLNVDVNDALATMYAAHKYDIKELFEHCGQVLRLKMSIETVVTCYETAILLNNMELQNYLWEFIKLNAGDLLESKQFLEFSEDNLCKFLETDEMPTVASEVDVFKAVLKWGRNQCEKEGITTEAENLKNVLKNLIPLIRFPTMEYDEFIDTVESSGILSESECLKLCKYFLLSGEKQLSILKTLQYPLKQRDSYRFVFCSIAAVDNCVAVAEGPGVGDSFSVAGNTGNVKLKAVGIVIPRFRSVAVRVTDLASGQLIAVTTKTVTKSMQIFFLEFDTAVGIRSNVQYNIIVYDIHPFATRPLIQYTKGLMKTQTRTLNTADKQQLTFIPSSYVIWALQFQC